MPLHLCVPGLSVNEKIFFYYIAFWGIFIFAHNYPPPKKIKKLINKIRILGFIYIVNYLTMSTSISVSSYLY